MNTQKVHKKAMEACGGAWGYPLWRELDLHYREPHRAYHNWDHIETMLAILGTSDPELVLATFYHDAIYIPGSDLNEYFSLELAAVHMAEMKCDRRAITRVCGLIEDTRDHRPTTRKAELFLDADLAILAASPTRYDEYTKQIETEYTTEIDKHLYIAGRIEAMEKFLDHDKLYYVHTHWEDDARANIERELNNLRSR